MVIQFSRSLTTECFNDALRGRGDIYMAQPAQPPLASVDLNYTRTINNNANVYLNDSVKSH